MNHDPQLIRACVLNYLREIRNIKESLESIEEQVERQSSRLDLMGITYNDMPHSPNVNTDKVPDGVSELIELRESLDAAYYSYARELERARSICLPVNFPAYLLWLHHVEGLAWWKVANKVGYSTDHTQHIAAKGYEYVYQMMPEEYRLIPKAL